MTQAIKVGDKVRFICESKHLELPEFYPKVGAIGTAVKLEKNCVRVQWEKGTTTADDLWWCEKDWVEVVE